MLAVAPCEARELESEPTLDALRESVNGMSHRIANSSEIELTKNICMKQFDYPISVMKFLKKFPNLVHSCVRTSPESTYPLLLLGISRPNRIYQGRMHQLASIMPLC